MGHFDSTIIPVVVRVQGINMKNIAAHIKKILVKSSLS